MGTTPIKLFVILSCTSISICFLYAIFSTLEYYVEVKSNCHLIMPTEYQHSTIEEGLTIQDKVRKITNCFDKHRKQRIEYRGDNFVLYNYVQSALEFKCEESITFTTHADISFMKHLPIIVERWQGPVSIALFAPGSDFNDTINAVLYMKYCLSNAKEIDKWVTFHIYFGRSHIPDSYPTFNDPILQTFNCSTPPSYENINTSSTYKYVNKLEYPINIGRNIARIEAQTHFVFAVDIELYPSLGIIPKFLKMIADNTDPALQIFPRIFTLHEFEVDIKNKPPGNKKELVEMVRNESVVLFHKYICPVCHAIPKTEEWLNASISENLNIFNVAQRVGKYNHWEAVFIGTNDEPLFEERLSWEGMSDKMINGFKLCAMNYSYLILDNAFLAHSPGIKRSLKQKNEFNVILNRQNFHIWTKLWPQYNKLFGKNPCVF